MATKPLTEEELALLRSNPNVACVLADRIVFTPEFKCKAYDLLVTGKTMREILSDHGIDPEILGSKRIWGITFRIKEDAGRDGGFADLRQQNRRRPAKETREQTLEVRVRQLEHELAYTRQEVEFLKKIQAADSEAQKQWESRQRRK